jgi:hypothetical protein
VEDNDPNGGYVGVCKGYMARVGVSPDESIKHSEYGESLKSRMLLIVNFI